MLHRQESYFLNTTDTNAVLGAVRNALVQRGIGEPAANPAGLQAQCPPAGSYAMPRVSVNVFPNQGGMQIQLSVKSEIESTGMTYIILSMLFFWPIALYLFWQAHQSHERASQDLMNTMRAALGPYLPNPAAGVNPYGATMGVPQVPPGPTNPGNPQF